MHPWEIETACGLVRNREIGCGPARALCSPTFRKIPSSRTELETHADTPDGALRSQSDLDIVSNFTY